MRLLGDTANLTGLSPFRLDGNTGNGGLTARVRPKARLSIIDGTLALETLNFDRYLRAPAVIDDVGGSGDKVAAVPLPEFGSLRGVDVDLRLSAAQVTGANITFGQTAASLVVRAGMIDIGIGEAAYRDGQVSGNLKITPQPNGKSLSIQTKLNLRNVSVASLFEGGPLFGIEGAINGSIALEGAGYTVEQLVRSLRGDGRMEIKNGFCLRGIDVAAIVQSMTSKDFNTIGIRPGLTTPFQTLTIDLVTEGGITRTRTLELIGDRFQATASGKIDLLKRICRRPGPGAVLAERTAEAARRRQPARGCQGLRDRLPGRRAARRAGDPAAAAAAQAGCCNAAERRLKPAERLSGLFTQEPRDRGRGSWLSPEPPRPRPACARLPGAW
ncbi:MAG: AsmA family protein [Rhodobiaceae bacterium]|nr:AsmA family protein [Rhodobiaceae bacterium]